MSARISKEDFKEKVLQSQGPVLVDFYSDSCIACKKLAPVLGDVEDEYEGTLSVYKVNTSYDQELVETYQIMANPTLKLFQAGEVVATKVGVATVTELKDWIQKNIYWEKKK